MKDSPQPSKRRRYDTASQTKALRLAGESRSTQAAARALNIDPKRLYKWQKEALTPVAAARGGGPWRRPVAAARTRPPPPGCASCGPPIGDRRRSWTF